ncbi:hypothetical protein [Paenibacillus methanolicus]|nr:hypothetical protein [Paenibacillus methanolicus]
MPDANGCSFCDELFADGLCLPSGSEMTEAEQEPVASVIRAVYAGAAQAV